MDFNQSKHIILISILIIRYFILTQLIDISVDFLETSELSNYLVLCTIIQIYLLAIKISLTHIIQIELIGLVVILGSKIFLFITNWYLLTEKVIQFTTLILLMSNNNLKQEQDYNQEASPEPSPNSSKVN